MERVGSVARSICSRHTRHGVDRSHFSLRDFFRGISANFELGKDFLREMNTPIHVSGGHEEVISTVALGAWTVVST